MWKDRERNRGYYTYKEETFVEHMVEHFYEDFLYTCVLTLNQTERFNSIEEYVEFARNNENTDVESMLEYFTEGYRRNVNILYDIEDILENDYFYKKGNKPNFHPLEVIDIAAKTNQEVIPSIKELIRKDFKNGKKTKIDKNDYSFVIKVGNDYIAVKLFGELPYINEKEKWIRERNIVSWLVDSLSFLREYIQQDITRCKKEGLCVLHKDYHYMDRGYWFILEDYLCEKGSNSPSLKKGGKQILKYAKELDLISENTVQPMNNSTVIYNNPCNSTVQNFEDQLRLVNDMVNNFYCCLKEADYEIEKDCNYCCDYNYEYDIDKRYELLLIEVKKIEKAYKKAVNFMFL